MLSLGVMTLFFAMYNQSEIFGSTGGNGVQNHTSVESAQGIEVYNKVKDSVVMIDGVVQEANEKISINNQSIKAPPEWWFGSGFVYDNSGKIVTNYHVVEDTTKLVVTLANGNRYSAKVIGVDPVNDLAVVQIDQSALSKEKLSPIPIADPSTFRIGQPVVAIGSPLSYKNSLSEGIISHTGRTHTDLQSGTIWVGGFIQTDTAITHGNSGGPLLNMNGEVVGVNDWGELSRDALQTEVPGLNFAISSGTVKRVIPQLISEGNYSYPWMGMGIEDVSPFAAKKIGLNETSGVIVRWVVPDSPADLSGIMYGDVILKADKLVIKEKTDIVEYLRTKYPDDIISLDILRSNGSTHDILIKIGALGNSSATY